jgi:hypothetical protein
MGKAAKVERIKLMATFLNNIAVGLVVAGALVPYLSFISATAANQPLRFWITTQTAADFKRFAAIFLVMIFAFIGAGVLHYMASKILNNIED